MSGHAIRAAALCLGVLTLTGGVVGCSSETAPSEPTGTTTGSTSHGSYAHCLTEHGVPAPQPGTATGAPEAPPGVDPDTWDTAMKDCASLAPGPPGPST
jgi:hypothetical protein